MSECMVRNLHDMEVQTDEKDSEIWLASDRPTGLFYIRSTEVVDAEEIGTDDFPKYGEFMAVSKGDTAGYLQLTAHLIEHLQEHEAQQGDEFKVTNVVEGNDGGYWWDASPVVDGGDNRE